MRSYRLMTKRTWINPNRDDVQVLYLDLELFPAHAVTPLIIPLAFRPHRILTHNHISNINTHTVQFNAINKTITPHLTTQAFQFKTLWSISSHKPGKHPARLTSEFSVREHWVIPFMHVQHIFKYLNIYQHTTISTGPNFGLSRYCLVTHVPEHRSVENALR